MQLNITPELITELHDYGQQTGRPADTVIILTPNGWDTSVIVDGVGFLSDNTPTLTPITAQGIYDWLDGGDFDQDCAEALAHVDDESHDYLIPNEHGDYDVRPHPSWDVQVVTGSSDTHGDITHDWRDAWWFNADDATQLTTTSDSGHTLWRTSGGRWLDNHGDDWTEVTDERAAEWIYNTSEDNLIGDPSDRLPLVKAALAARALADAFTVPEVPTVPTGYFNDRERHPQDALDDATDVVIGIRAVTEHLLKQVMLPRMRLTRSYAAEVAVEAFDGNQSAAARHLNMSQSTLNKLLPRDDADHLDD